MASVTNSPPAEGMSRSGRMIVLSVAFLGWMFAGLEMSIIPLVTRPAILSFQAAANEVQASVASDTKRPSSAQEKSAGGWLSWYISAFLLGAAAGGLLFGWLGDKIGRAKAMALSILCYSIITGLTAFVTTPMQLLVLRFLACLGVGGMWPTGVSLVAEAWSDVSRPTLAGLIGTAANVGFIILGFLGLAFDITPQSWRWVFLVGGLPAILGVFALFAVPESPSWLQGRTAGKTSTGPSPVREILRPPLLSVTIIGILLGTIPVVGNWGGANWTVMWADKVAGASDPALKAWTQITRSSGAAIGSLIGGWLASLLGRRFTYFALSLAALLVSGYIFRFLSPGDPTFGTWVFILGFVGVTYFGWLPLYLPELFPTNVRATGTGVTFNFGRILAVPGVLGAGSLLHLFDGDYSKVGTYTSLIYLAGMIVICFAPDTSQRKIV
ncbi:MAG: MFS transporter [Planctomycetota bacterium]